MIRYHLQILKRETRLQKELWLPTAINKKNVITNITISNPKNFNSITKHQKNITKHISTTVFYRIPTIKATKSTIYINQIFQFHIQFIQINKYYNAGRYLDYWVLFGGTAGFGRIPLFFDYGTAGIF